MTAAQLMPSAIPDADLGGKCSTVVQVGQVISAHDDVAFANSERFHQKLVIHSRAAQRDLDVTFSVAGSEEENAPTVLFVGGLYGGRFSALWVDFLCRKKGIRVVFIDRPGYGASTAVDRSLRVRVWLETVPAVLAKLAVPRVSLVAHSCGVVYAFNTMQALPHLLAPTRIYLMCPWVHPSKSGVRMLSLASLLPSGVMKSLGKVTSFLVRRLLSDKPTKAKASAQSDGVDKVKLTADDDKLLATCGYTAAEGEVRRNYYIKRFFDEDTGGVAEEFNMGVQDIGKWGVCQDYAVFAAEYSRQCEVDGRKPCIHAVFAAKDTYVGQGGRDYFNAVWSDAAARGSITYTSEEVEGLEHEGPITPEYGVLERVFDDLVSVKA